MHVYSVYDERSESILFHVMCDGFASQALTAERICTLIEVNIGVRLLVLHKIDSQTAPIIIVIIKFAI